MKNNFPSVKNIEHNNSGLSCLNIIVKYYNNNYNTELLKNYSLVSNDPTSFQDLSFIAETIGLRTRLVKINYLTLKKKVRLPCIIQLDDCDFIVVYKISKDNIFISEPNIGLKVLNRGEFCKKWIKQGSDGMSSCLLLEPTYKLFESDDVKFNKISFSFIFSYLRPYKKWAIQLVIGLLAGMALQFAFPFLTQSLVDNGINNRNIELVYLILIAQLVLFISQTAIEFIRSWILLHVSSRINISLISDFLIKLMRIPMSYFTPQAIGDTMQRVSDHTRVESFLTSSLINMSVSCVNMVVFGVVLIIFDIKIFFVFVLGSLLYTIWVCLFLKKRRELDFKKFFQLVNGQNILIQLLSGIQEIKLNNIERQKRWDWERIQVKLLNININGLIVNQWQQSGSILINQLKNVTISFLSAKAVIDGDITLGTMMAIQYIVGQLNSPIEQLIFLFRSLQDAKISLERIGEIYKKKNEETYSEYKNNYIPESGAIQICNLSFHYPENNSLKILDNLNVTIPRNKTTAIVGSSGSGKTTLLKLIMGFYEPITGEIKIGDTLINTISRSIWRKKCGMVMQDGFIFSDTLIKNIVLTDEPVDRERMLYSVKMANIQDYIESLPLKYNTVVGMNGHGLSQGQRQRILIARAIYKNPDFVLLDEATNALDANNEKIITENLTEFFKERTVIAIAHRLSSVRNADQLIVLDGGKIVENGTHNELINMHGKYYKLIKNQLDFGE